MCQHDDNPLPLLRKLTALSTVDKRVCQALLQKHYKRLSWHSTVPEAL